MFSTLIKFLLISLICLVLQVGSAFSQNRRVTYVGMAYNHTFGFDLEIQRLKDNKKYTAGNSFSGASFIYEPILNNSLNLTFAGGIMSRFTREKLYSGDITDTDINEEVMWLQSGLSTQIKKLWIFVPYASLNLTYFSISSKIKSNVTNSSTLKSALNANSETPYLDTSINTSIVNLSAEFGINYQFKYSGLRFFVQTFPHYFNKGGTINNYYNYEYKYTGYLLGLGFLAYL